VIDSISAGGGEDRQGNGPASSKRLAQSGLAKRR
jgi:hypothetical protein